MINWAYGLVAIASAVAAPAAPAVASATPTPTAPAITAAPTTTATATAAVSTAAAATTIFAGAGFIDGEGSATVLLAVECLDGGLGFIVIGHLDEPEPLAAAGVSVVDDLGGKDLAMLAEQLLEL